MVKVKVVRGAVDMDGDKLPFYLWDSHFTVVVIEHLNLKMNLL